MAMVVGSLAKTITATAANDATNLNLYVRSVTVAFTAAGGCRVVCNKTGVTNTNTLLYVRGAANTTQHIVFETPRFWPGFKVLSATMTMMTVYYD